VYAGNIWIDEVRRGLLGIGAAGRGVTGSVQVLEVPERQKRDVVEDIDFPTRYQILIGDRCPYLLDRSVLSSCRC
jgi:hypothetical protein